MNGEIFGRMLRDKLAIFLPKEKSGEILKVMLLPKGQQDSFKTLVTSYKAQ